MGSGLGGGLVSFHEVISGPPLVSGVFVALWNICYVAKEPRSVSLSFTLTEIARHFRFGSQEDAHEFLRYTIDAMQKACLNGYTKYGQLFISGWISH